MECTGLRASTGRGHHDDVLTDDDRALLAASRRAVLATIAPDGRPRPVPVCFVVDPDRPVVYIPLDRKPKRSEDPLALARVRDIAADARVTLLADLWDEDWSRLAWIRLEGHAGLVQPADAGHPDVVAALRARYLQYERQRLEDRPIIRVDVDRVVRWSLSG
jgi:PPOX class probable F420-dependent enzyme